MIARCRDPSAGHLDSLLPVWVCVLCFVVALWWPGGWFGVGFAFPFPLPSGGLHLIRFLHSAWDNLGRPFGSAGSPRPSPCEGGAVAGWPGCVLLWLLWVVVLWVAGCRFCSATLWRLLLFLRSGTGLSPLLAARPSFLPPALGCTRPVVFAANYCTFLRQVL